MADTSDIKKGLTINYNHDIYTVVDFQHVKPGKGPAFVRTKIKSVTTGKVLDNTWPSGHKLDVVRVERRTYQYLYNDGSTYYFMEDETYEQIQLEAVRVPNRQLLKEEAKVEILTNAKDDSILTVEIPTTVILEVTYTEPGIKGDTATNTLKPATVETGAEVRVPLFINTGDRVKINTETGAYMERVKS